MAPESDPVAPAPLAPPRRPRLRWLLLAALVLNAAGVGYVLVGRNQGADRSPGQGATEPAAKPTEPGRGVVCFGYVDLRQGVRSLSVVQPGRVKEVVAAEG